MTRAQVVIFVLSQIGAHGIYEENLEISEIARLIIANFSLHANSPYDIILTLTLFLSYYLGVIIGGVSVFFISYAKVSGTTF